jgi:hypothetical protein
MRRVCTLAMLVAGLLVATVGHADAQGIQDGRTVIRFFEFFRQGIESPTATSPTALVNLDVPLFTVPLGQRLVITDVIMVNYGVNLGQRLREGCGQLRRNGTPVTAWQCPGQLTPNPSTSQHYVTGIEFLQNDRASFFLHNGDITLEVRGYITER